jgi:hypothetical protein
MEHVAGNSEGIMGKCVLCSGVLAAGLMISACAGFAQGTPSMIEGAEQGLYPVVSDPPLVGAFYSWQLPILPPTPFNPFPDSGLTVYDLGGGLFLTDDRSVNYNTPMTADSLSLPGTNGGGQPYGPQPLTPMPNYGCGLWLEISATNASSLVTIHNTTSGRSYTVWSSTNLAIPVASWTAETNVTATGDSARCSFR